MDNQFPFDTIEKPFQTWDFISLKIISSNGMSLQLAPFTGTLLLTHKRLIWYCEKRTALNSTEQQLIKQIEEEHSINNKEKEMLILNDQGKSIMIPFENLISHGLEKGYLVCISKRNEDEDFMQQQYTNKNENTLFLDIREQKDNKKIIHVQSDCKFFFGLQAMNEKEQDDLFDSVSILVVDFENVEDEQKEEIYL